MSYLFSSYNIILLHIIGVAYVQGFSHTIAKQLGYSPMAVGFVLASLSILSLVVKPVFRIIVDKFPVKRITFLTGFVMRSLGIYIELCRKIANRSHFGVHDLVNTTTTLLLNDDADYLLKFVKNNTSKSVKCQVL